MRVWFVLIVAMGFVPCCGCGSKEGKRLPVSGKVYFRGAPLDGGMIVFTPDPDRGGQGPIAKAIIGTDGSFTLTVEDKPGIAPGWYRIAIAGNTTEPPTPANPYPGPPSKYRNPDISGMVREVRVGADNVFEFTLEDS